ncbi:hypothetical protein [Streptomyces mirabilis]|uniref:hypothetical protein n=1 Tax=Streptomyces mirabilis TaxID=68239 RepID=UPI00225029A1|nr:hypothetical protein [Streptomyces mirabilis]MCX4608694.1 hypothetical protein [Streptomyces mirabilis]
MSALIHNGKPYKTPHAVWAAILRTQGPEGKAVLKAYREGLWAQRELAKAPPLTVAQTQMLRRVKGTLVKAVWEKSVSS